MIRSDLARARLKLGRVGNPVPILGWAQESWMIHKLITDGLGSCGKVVSNHSANTNKDSSRLTNEVWEPMIPLSLPKTASERSARTSLANSWLRNLSMPPAGTTWEWNLETEDSLLTRPSNLQTFTTTRAHQTNSIKQPVNHLLGNRTCLRRLHKLRDLAFWAVATSRFPFGGRHGATDAAAQEPIPLAPNCHTLKRNHCQNQQQARQQISFQAPLQLPEHVLRSTALFHCLRT